MDFLSDHWQQIALVYLIVKNVLTGIREAIDSTPDSDDTPFEKFVTFVSGFSQYFVLGKRSK